MPMGRPTDYTPELADQICEEIENSPRSLNYICEQHPAFPVARTIRRWISQIPEFNHKYALAKEKQADFMGDEIIDVAYDDKADWKVIVDDNGNEKTVFVKESCNRSRLKMDALKLRSSQLNPKKYGTKWIDNKGDVKSFMESIHASLQETNKSD